MKRFAMAATTGFVWGLVAVGFYWLVVSMFNLR